MNVLEYNQSYIQCKYCLNNYLITFINGKGIMKNHQRRLYDGTIRLYKKVSCEGSGKEMEWENKEC